MIEKLAKLDATLPILFFSMLNVQLNEIIIFNNFL